MPVEEHKGSGPFEACPECGSSRLKAVFDGDETNFFCESCGRCWFVTMGWTTRVVPSTCPGCSELGRCRALAPARGETPPDGG